MKTATHILNNGSFGSRYTFSAKEKDVETGYGYFGSRYYSSDLSIWLSVDPMTEKYPSMSAYMYCADNPVKLVDPNGREIGDVDEASQKKIDALTNKSGADYNRAFTRIFKQLERSKKMYNFYEAKESEISGNTQGKVTRSEDGNSINIISSIGGVRTSKEGGFSKEYATMFEETFHAADYDKGRLDLNNPTCRDEARAWKFASKAPGTTFWDDDNYRYTFAGCVKIFSVKELAHHFYKGKVSYVDKTTGEGHSLINAKNGKGLYYYLPEK